MDIYRGYRSLFGNRKVGGFADAGLYSDGPIYTDALFLHPAKRIWQAFSLIDRGLVKEVNWGQHLAISRLRS